MIKEQKTTSRNGVFFSVMRGGFALFCLGKGLPFQIAVRFYRAIERDDSKAWDLGKSTAAAGEKAKMTQKQ